MGNLCGNQSQKCPLHQNMQIESVCLHARCIQPLCKQCLPKHHTHHIAIGVPPILKPLKEINKSLNTSMHLEADTYAHQCQFSESVRRISTPDFIKELTRQYFLKKRPAARQNKDLKLSETIDNLEMAQTINTPENRQKIKSFLRKNLEANNAVIEESFRSFY